MADPHQPERKLNYCPACGTKLEQNAKTCNGCGKLVPKEISMQFADAVEKVAQFSEKTLPQVEAHLNQESARFITPGIFIFTFLCLFFPFVNIVGFTFSGFNMAFGLNPGWGVRIGGHWAGVLLLLFILAGIGLSFWQNENRPKIVTIISALGLLILLGLAIGINSYLSRELGAFRGIVNINLSIGFYLLFLSFLVVGAINYYYMKRQM